MEQVRRADVVVVFGASLNQFTMRYGELFAPGTQVVQVDTGTAATHPHVGRFIHGDARAVAEQLRDALVELAPSRDARDEPIDTGPLVEREQVAELAPDGRLDPRAAAARLADLLPADRVVVSDGGHFIGWANMYWPVQSPDRMVMVGTAYQAIGLGMPSLVGAAAARAVSTIVLSTGDGGGLTALADLESAIRVAAGRGLIVVWNDGQYSAETNVYGALGLAREPMLIPEVDFGALARALGAEGLTVTRLADLYRLQEWTQTSADHRRLLLLDLRVSPAIVAPYQLEVLRQMTR